MAKTPRGHGPEQVGIPLDALAGIKAPRAGRPDVPAPWRAGRRDALLAEHLERTGGRGPLGPRDHFLDAPLRDGLRSHGLTPAWKQKRKGAV